MNQTFFQSFLDKTYEPQGLPKDYPIPVKDGLLFYIQRNQNINTVVYEINLNQMGDWNLDEPMKVYWIKYNELQEEAELNYIQNKLAYGYRSRVISPELVEFEFVSYNKKFFIRKQSNGTYQVTTRLMGKLSVLSNMYVYAEEFGVFPEVKFVELYGTCVETHCPCFEKIIP